MACQRENSLYSNDQEEQILENNRNLFFYSQEKLMKPLKNAKTDQ